MFSTSGDVQYIGRCSVYKGDTMSTSEDMLGTSGNIMSASRDFQEII